MQIFSMMWMNSSVNHNEQTELWVLKGVSKFKHIGYELLSTSAKRSGFDPYGA